jgi:hypothetical protein
MSSQLSDHADMLIELELFFYLIKNGLTKTLLKYYLFMKEQLPIIENDIEKRALRG